MGERKGTNKYYPPDFDPKIHRNLNAYHGTHALRDRGKKADQGVITIRFEMPFNCWCLTCKNPIGMGVRYNAEKFKVGMYHSTPIYKFTMPCSICAGTIVIQTDPKNFDYVILEGARRKNQKWDPEENEQLVISDATEKKKLALDAMYHLEHNIKDEAKATCITPIIRQLEEDRLPHKDDFLLNSLARKQFREAKRAAIEADAKDARLMNRLSLLGSEVKLLPEDEADRDAAALLRLANPTKVKRSRKLDIACFVTADEISPSWSIPMDLLKSKLSKQNSNNSQVEKPAYLAGQDSQTENTDISKLPDDRSPPASLASVSEPFPSCFLADNSANLVAYEDSD